MSILIDNWTKAKKAREIAEGWNSLPSKTGYGLSKFSISISQSKAPTLVRAGQLSSGGQNYWTTESEFNSAILEYLVNNWDDIFPGVLSIMEKRENLALVKCQDYITEMQDLINNVQPVEVLSK